MIGDMNTDPHQIRADVDAVLAELPRFDPDAAPSDPAAPEAEIDIEAVGNRLEQAHQILVDALESVEKG